MSLTKFIVENAALSLPRASLIPAFCKQEKEKDGEVVLEGRLHETIRRLNPAIPEEVWATIKRHLKVRFVRRLNP